jgi:stage II sporulation protein D
VAATSGQIVTYRGAPAVTYFFSSSGGHTENIEDAWPGAVPEPWLRGVADPYDDAAGNPYHHWSYTLSMATAQARLGSLVRGGLLGIRVLRTGASPRIVLAQVVGTAGSTSVSGGQLEGALGLPSTDAAFTSVVTLPGPAPRPAGDRRVHARPHRRAARFPAGWAVTRMVNAIAPRASLALHGTVFPARPGEVVAIQAAAGRWRTVAHVRLGGGGTYGARVAGPGRYRIVYRGLDGPAVTVR